MVKTPRRRWWAVAARPATQFLLDSATDINGQPVLVAGAYSLRKMRSNYVGPLVTLRRSSDNQTADIGFRGAAGDFDMQAFNAFIGADTAFVVRWHDQSGYNNHASNLTQAVNQPQLIPSVAALNNRPGIQFGDAGAICLAANAMPQVANVFATGGWWSFVGNFGAATQPDHFYNKAQPSFHLGAAGTNTFVFGQTASTTAGTWTTPALGQGGHVMDVAYNSSSNANVPVISLDGTAQSLTSVQPVGTITSDAANGITFGNNVAPTGGVRGWAGAMVEVLTYASQPVSGPIRANQKAYWGTP